MNLVILTNIMTPYRKFFYDELNKECKKNNIEFHVVFMADTEKGRHWKYDDLKTDYSILLPHKTLQIGNIEIHINKGIKKLYKKIKPSIVICGGSYLYPAVWRTIALSKKLGFKIIEWNETHLNESRNYNNLKLKIREFLRKKIISKFHIFWCAGDFAKKFVEKYAQKDSKYIFVPNLINVNRFSEIEKYSKENIEKIREEMNIPNENRVYITPARLIPVKGLLEFLELYKDCEIQSATYLIAGDGELKEEISEYVSKNNLDVRLLGNKSEKEIIKLYAISDGFILPSKSDANPLTCIEACWCKLPILVSTHVGNYPEIVKEGENGSVFSYQNEREAKEKINQFLNNSNEWYNNAKVISYDIANKIYEPNNTVKRVIKETLDIVREQ